ncbi:ABC transporter substrate-binding protein [Pseudodesulfovibrio sp. zrk46]|uniref:ABC transporter substrate-binding protein n=1 Tax=Pseudodesulfovibrio sp. zrk46 TaxID=2725288 RepID=UPI00144A256C|nr:ABC transporter substrate-binding protein [Pseudodesulfovibrio sp. zrk46]QJB56448.1 substrate-binding domain-containing protein [Pseudodesulfovibrio sp. zrk46]
MRFVLVFAIVCAVVCSWQLPVLAAETDEPIRVTMVSPTCDNKHPFWSEYLDFMNAAADSLGIELTLVCAGDRIDAVNVARKAMADPGAIDYLVHVYLAASSCDLLEAAERKGVNIFTVNTGIMASERDVVGYPREKYEHWIGHLHPDDAEAGKLLAQKLLDRARALKIGRGELHVIGIGGGRDSAASVDRGKAFQQVVKDAPDADLSQYVLTDWDSDVAYKKTCGLLVRHHKARVYWAASDALALGAAKALQEAGLEPGKDSLVGGLDWTHAGLDAVRNGTLEASVGGHFMEGAWVLALIYDHYHGKDFSTQGTTQEFHMQLVDRSNLETYLPVLNHTNWKRIDFKQFTRTHNPRLKRYDFSPDAVVRQLARR